MNPFCSTPTCPIFLNSTCVFYQGANLVCTGINTNETLESALIKINNKICSFPTLQQVTSLGASTTVGIIVNKDDYTPAIIANNTTGLAISATSDNGIVARFNLDTAGNTSNIVEFLKTGVTQSYITHDGKVNANAFVKQGGLSTQFLMANGSVSTGLATTVYVDNQDALKVDKVVGERLINASEITKLGILDPTTDLQKPLSTATINALALKLATGGYTGTAEDLRILIVNATTGVTGTSVVPTSTPTGTGVASFIAVQAGTYTNFGSVVVAANSIAVISRNAAGAFSVSQTVLNLTEYAKKTDNFKIETWTAKAYLLGDQVNYLGKDWVSNTATVATDLPGISSKWLIRLTSYENKANLVVSKNLFNKVTTTDDYYLSNTNGITALAGFCYSDYIAVVPGQSYKPSVSLRFTTYYDANKNYIAGGSNGDTSATFVIPAGVYFLRFTLSSLALKDTCQLELGTISTTYSAYKLVVSASELELTEYAKTANLPAIITPFIALKADLVVGKNLFNKATTTDGYYRSATNSIVASATFCYSDFIAVVAGSSYKATTSLRFTTYFDANKNYVAGGNSTATTGVITIPVGVAFIVLSLEGLALKDTCQFELGSVNTTYEAYKLIVNSNQLNLIEYSKTADFPAIITPLIALKADLVVGKNLFNYADADAKRLFYLNATGVPTAVNPAFDDFSISGFIPATSGQTFRINQNFMANTYNCFYDSNKAFIAASNSLSNTITAPTNTAFVRFTITLLAETDIATANIQIELGSVVTTYEPYKTIVPATQLNLTEYAKTADFPAIITPLIASKADLVVGKNLFNKAASAIIDSKYISTGGAQNSNVLYFISDYIPVLPSTSYVHSNFNIGGALCAIYDTNKAFIATFNSTTITIPSNGYFVRMSGTISNKSIQQFELGTVSTVYAAYALQVNPAQIVFPAQSTYNNKIACPLKQHFLSTIENNIYLTEFQKRDLPNFILDTTTTVGSRKNDIIRALNPIVGSYSITNALVDLDYADVMRKNYTVVVTDLSKTTAINVLSIGDSYTDIGQYVKKMGETLPNITHLGMCKSVSGTDVKREGRSGWTLANYMTQTGSTAVTGFFSPFLHPVSPYTYYGNTDFWKKVFLGVAPGYEITSFVPWLSTLNINSSGVRATPVINDVMYFTIDSVYKYWDGSAWNIISAATLNFSFNFAKYLTTWSVPTPNVITILLGMNDFRSIVPTVFDAFFTGWKANLDTFIASAKLANSSVKIVLATCNSVEYNDLSGRANAALWEGYNAVITAYDNREAENIFISDTKASVDRVLGFPGSRTLPFSNYTGSETTWYTGGDVHLNTGGMNQIGQKLAATIQYAR